MEMKLKIIWIRFPWKTKNNMVGKKKGPLTKSSVLYGVWEIAFDGCFVLMSSEKNPDSADNAVT